MSDDEADPKLVALLRQSLGLGSADGDSSTPPSTRVLESAEFIYDNAIDVAISTSGTKAAAETVYRQMQTKGYSTETWASHPLHPQAKDESTLNFIFTMNLLNFSFWSTRDPDARFAVEYQSRRWTGYWSLVAALRRALDEGYAITTPDFWQDLDACPDTLLEHIFRSATDEPMPLLAERVAILREAGHVLYSHFRCRVANVVETAKGSAARLVNLLVEHFPNFCDTATFHGRKVRLYKRAQILVADVWACFNGTSYGDFGDIGSLTMFADYRIPQMLQALHCLTYSPRLESKIARLEELPAGDTLEAEIRGCSIWCVELLRREIVRNHPDVVQPEKGGYIINAVLIDYFLYDTCKEMEERGEMKDILPHHRTRSIYY